MRFKEHVDPAGVQPPIWYALGVHDTLQRSVADSELIVTSLKNGKHKTTSKHYLGMAYDARSWNVERKNLDWVLARLRDYLTPIGFDVLLEESPPHIHVEFDPKPGRTLPFHFE